MNSGIQSIDQLGHRLTLYGPPERIVSLVPSQTELLFDLGLAPQIAGITRYCIHPAHRVAEKEVVGGTKRFDVAAIRRLDPDLIIGNKEENDAAAIAALQREYRVWMSDIQDIAQALAMMREIGRITGRAAAAEALIRQIDLPKRPPAAVVRQAAYFIWRKPYMVAAGHTFIDDMLQRLGVTNVFGHLARYPSIPVEQLRQLQPDFIFLSSEPYAFRQVHVAEFQSFSPKSQVVLVDGEMFSWYGSRLRLAGAYFARLREQLGFDAGR